MAIFDIFDKKKKIVKTKPVVKKPEEIKIVQRVAKRENKFEQTYRVLKTPHVTEKAGDLTVKNQYIFKVLPRTDKNKIKKAIAGLYSVDVVSVKIINVLPKKRKLGRISGWTKGYKKAIVRIKKGQKIEVLPR